MRPDPDPACNIDLRTVACIGTLRLEATTHLREQCFGWRVVDACTGAVIVAEVADCRLDYDIGLGLAALRRHASERGIRNRIKRFDRRDPGAR